MTSSGDETGKKERMARNFQVDECNGDVTPVGSGLLLDLDGFRPDAIH